ncbi:hypothetical protein D3C84_895750 [compost metagenome]
MVTRAFRGDSQTVQLARQTNSEIADVDHFLNFTQTFLVDFASFDRYQFTKLVFVLTQHFAEHTNQFATTRRRYISPSQEGLMRKIDLFSDGSLAL